MSSPSQLYINLGSGHISIAEFDQITPGGGTLKAFYRESLDYNFLDEDQWLGATTSALRRLTSFNKISGPAHIILPGFVLLAKAIKVPHVDASRQAQIIAFEAQQNIPFPLNEVVWTYQIVHDDGVEADVLLVAVKSDIAEGVTKMLGSLRIDPVSLLASPVLDYNAYQFNHPDEEEEFLLVNVGMKNTNLAFGSKDNLTLRNVALGGNALTQTVANNLGKNFTEAESLKVAYYSTEVPDEEHEFASIFATNSETFIKRIQSDLTRTLTTYKRQRQGKGPSKIVLTGGGSLLPGLPEYFAEKLNLPIEYLNPIERITMGPKVPADQVERYGFQMGELVGAAVAQELGKYLRLDLLPDELVNRRRFQKQKPIIGAAALICGAAFIYPWIATQQQLDAARDNGRLVESAIIPLRSNQEKIQRLTTDYEAELERVERLRSVANSLYNWNDFLIDLQNRLQAVGDVWIDALEVNRDTPARPMAARGGFGAPAAATPRGFEEEESTEPRPLQLKVRGRFVDRTNPTGAVSEGLRVRVNQLIDLLNESPYLERVGDLEYPTGSPPGTLTFDFTITIDPEKPL